MKRFSMMIALVATMTATSLVSAQGQRFAQATQSGQQRLVVAPPTYPSPVPTANQFYFGMNVNLLRLPCGTTTLRVVSVNPGSPAYLAGLEVGDEIRTVNGRGFHFARDSFEAVRMMNQYVSQSGGGTIGAPAVAAAAVAGPGTSTGAQALISPRPFPQPQPMAYMVVRNVRNGQNVGVTVYPQQQFLPNPGLIAPASPVPAASAIQYRGR